MSFFQPQEARSRRSARHIIIMAGLALALAALAPHRATAAEVAIMTNGKAAPASVTIAVGQQINWRNFGAGPRSVVAAQNAFPAFTVAAQGNHAQPFLKVGNFPYQVDKQFNGVVNVTAQKGQAQATQDILAGPDNCGHPGILSYDVHVYGFREEHADVALPTKGEITHTAEWTADWQDVKVGATKCFNKLNMAVDQSNATTLSSGEQATGQLQGSFDYSDTAPPRPNSSDDPRCHFRVDLNAPEFLMIMHSSSPPPGGTLFILQTRPNAPDEKNSPGAQITAASHQCKRNMRSGGGASGEPAGNQFKPRPVNGVDFDIANFIVQLKVEKPIYLAFPVKELVERKGFAIDSGEQTFQEYHSADVTDTVTDHVVVTFSPRQP
jgi:plastocyanin